MSPLLTARPSTAVTLRLVGACGVTAVAALIVALAGGGTASEPRLAWISAGVTIAFGGLIASPLASSALFPGGGLVVQDPDAGVARYLVLHVALVLSGALALRVSPRLPALIAFGGAGLALLLLTSFAVPVDGFVDTGGYTALTRAAVAAIVAGQLGVAYASWRRANRAPSWVELCVLSLMVLSALDALAYAVASQTYSGAWWASLALRAGQFAVPSVGLPLGFIAVADRVRDFEDELLGNLQAGRERGLRHEQIQTLDRRRRELVVDRVRPLIAGDGLFVAFQPIVDLASGQVVGAEALARFKDADGEPIPTERCFLDAHAVELGVELELAVIALALGCQDRLPAGRYLALNVSPAGAVVVSEGIESESELVCLKDLDVGCGQGFHLARPSLGAIDTHYPEPSVVA